MTDSLNHTPEDWKFINALAFVEILVELPVEEWPDPQFLQNKAKEILNVR